MRITFLLTQDLESPSGLGRYWPISKELTRMGYKVTILALHSNYESLEEYEKDFTREGVHVRYVGQMHVRKVGSRKHYFSTIRLLEVALKGIIELTLSALRTQSDAYHVGKPHPMNGLAGLIASRLHREPLYIDCDDYEAASNRFSGKWQRKIISFFEQVLPRLAHGVTTNTRFTLCKLSNLGISKERIVYVPNGVERSRFSSTTDRDVDKLRKQLNLESKKIILYLGSMSLASHAVDLLLEAFAIIRQAEPEAVLLLVGGGEDYDVLCARSDDLGVRDATRFMGRVHPAEAPLYYHLADVSVDPIRDNLASCARSPLKIVESLVTGTPVVTGNVGDRSEYLMNGQGGELVTPGDAKALASGILRILDDLNVSSKRKQVAKLAGRRYYWDVLACDFVRVYEPEYASGINIGAI